ncbi:hypothetical protein [Nocardia thailandica]|uniref:hypothetical protein n=1 Tax=Nocardia thailandica TaxID=257275 RepID=UPI000311E747|nr:hypothetical protein [Nocardia thailandica]
MNSRVPEPALVRSTLVALSGVVAFILGKNIDVSWIEPLVTLYGLAAPVIAGFLIRRAVTPVSDQVGLRSGQ